MNIGTGAARRVELGGPAASTPVFFEGSETATGGKAVNLLGLGTQAGYECYLFDGKMQ